MSDLICLTVNDSKAGIRIDKLLSDNTEGFTRSGITRLIAD